MRAFTRDHSTRGLPRCNRPVAPWLAVARLYHAKIIYLPDEREERVQHPHRDVAPILAPILGQRDHQIALDRRQLHQGILFLHPTRSVRRSSLNLAGLVT